MERKENRINKPLSLENLILAILDLENKNIISFEDFSALPFLAIKKKYFSMSNQTMIEKAIIKISNFKKGNDGPSEHITKTIFYEEGKAPKVILKKIIY